MLRNLYRSRSQLEEKVYVDLPKAISKELINDEVNFVLKRLDSLETIEDGCSCLLIFTQCTGKTAELKNQTRLSGCSIENGTFKTGGQTTRSRLFVGYFS